jgi:rhomboid protease GluP
MAERDASSGAAVSRKERAGPAVSRGDRGRISSADRLAFRQALDEATRRAIVTPLIVLACGAWFAAMTAARVPMILPSASQLVGWGANDGARVILRHEYWRLGASVFVHGGLIHLVMNMWSLLVIGPLVERIFGHVAFGVIYLAAGAGGAIASVAVPPLRVSVGASGAICGVLGGLLAFLVAHHRAIPPTVLGQLRKNVLGVVVVMAVLGAVVPNIDQAAHLGGLAAGFVSGLLLIGPWPVVPGRRRRVLARRIALGGAIAAALAGAAVVVVRRGEAAIPADRRLDDLTEQITPIVREFDAIRRDLARAIGRLDRREGAADLPATIPVVRDLRARAEANWRRVGAVRTFDPELLAIQASLVRALDEQFQWLDALDDDFATSERAFLEAVRQALAAMSQVIKDCTADRLRYTARHGLRPGLAPPRTAP